MLGYTGGQAGKGGGDGGGGGSGTCKVERRSE